MNPDFTHAESAVLATVLAALPQGFAVPALCHQGLPDFDVTPEAARHACNRLRQRGFVVRKRPYFRLSDAAMDFFADLRRELQ
jgi:hypothetical protein